MYEVSLVMSDDGVFRSILTDVKTRKIIRMGVECDNLSDALADFNECQLKWFNELNVPTNERDVWRVHVDLTLW